MKGWTSFFKTHAMYLNSGTSDKNFLYNQETLQVWNNLKGGVKKRNTKKRNTKAGLTKGIEESLAQQFQGKLWLMKTVKNKFILNYDFFMLPDIVFRWPSVAIGGKISLQTEGEVNLPLPVYMLTR